MAGKETFADWVGRVVEAEDSVPEQTARALAATLGWGPEARATAGIAPDGPLPPLWHWLAFLPEAPAAALAPSGQAPDPLLPPLPGVRIWTGGRLRFHGELRIGEPLHRRSEILGIAPEAGGVRVTVAHEISTARNLGVSEVAEHLFAPAPPAGPATPPRGPAAWRAPLALDPVRLFRFSAVTFDAERRHYDAPYAAGIGLPGLAVQDRLLAILLVETARVRREGAWPAAAGFQALRPLCLSERAEILGGAEADGRQALAVADGAGACFSAEILWEA